MPAPVEIEPPLEWVSTRTKFLAMIDDLAKKFWGVPRTTAFVQECIDSAMFEDYVHVPVVEFVEMFRQDIKTDDFLDASKQLLEFVHEELK